MATDHRIILGGTNPLENERIIAATRLANTNALATAGAQASRAGQSVANFLQRRSPGGQQMQQNVLARDEAATSMANAQAMDAERQIITQMIQGVKSAAPERQAEVYGQMVRQAEARGIDVPDWAEDFSNFDIIDRVYAMPPEELTDWQRKMSMLGPDEQLSATRIALGLQADANAQLRGQAGNDQTNLMREYDMARQQGYQGDLLQYQRDRRGGGMSVTMPDGTQINMGGPGGTVEAGERDKTRGREMGKLDAKRQEMARKALNGMGALERRDKVLLNAIDSALQQIEDGVLNTGLPGQLMRGIGGTSALELDKTMDTIKANLGFNELNDMRQNSPTGGALGQVTERELTFLQSTQGSLDTAQRDGKLKGVLQEIRDNLVASAADRRAAYERDFGIGEQQPAPDAQQFDAERTINGTRYIQRNGEWFVAP